MVISCQLIQACFYGRLGNIGSLNQAGDAQLRSGSDPLAECLQRSIST
jgi:hypothetical protein